MPNLLLVMLGGAAGAGLRYEVGRFTLHRLGPGFPWGTLTVNLVGGLLMGLLAGTLARVGSANEPWRLLLGVGLLGGFTTFSSFSLETFGMIERGQYVLASAYILISVAGALAGLAGGILFLRAVA